MKIAAARLLAARVPSSEISSSKTPALLGKSLDLNGLEIEAEEDAFTETLEGSVDKKKLLKRYMFAEAKSYQELETLIESLDNLETVNSTFDLMNEYVTVFYF